MNKRILILSSPDDLHADFVDRHLQKLSVQVDYFRFEQFSEESAFSYKLNGIERDTVLKLQSGTVVEFQKYDAIWHRRPGALQNSQFPEPWIADMVQSEARAALHAVLYGLDCLWVNHPVADFQSLIKLSQLELAAEIGLSIPKTIVTNVPQEARDFFDRCNGKVIYKLIAERTNRIVPAFENPRGIATMALRQEDIPFVEQIRFAPHLFQEQIQKQHEIRATVIGTKVFPVLIDSQAGKGSLDWRNDYSVKFEAVSIPLDIRQKCLEITRRLGLNYGAIDLCVTPQGEFVFFELNCAGQYLWAEARTDLPMSLELAKLLAGESEPLVRRAPDFVVRRHREAKKDF